ncbi:AUGMIN subunit 3-like [Malus domestica]|uniref:AUGMIN subunit 3-like n=1 Tax=Malus domestica TaxID=3750 RepID=UPI0004987912|nr:AUGMIN subunit 3-like isoform X2 [Malus domestica]
MPIPLYQTFSLSPNLARAPEAEPSALSPIMLLTIPGLCWELAQLQDTYILQGDYDLRVMRQEYYINWQKAFINHLVNQLARHQFLKWLVSWKRKTCSDHTPCLKLLNLRCMPTYQQQKAVLGRCPALIQATSDVRRSG